MCARMRVCSRCHQRRHDGHLITQSTCTWLPALPTATALESAQNKTEPLSEEVLSMLKTSSFISLLDNCATWMGANNSNGRGEGLDELPQINFLLKGENAEPTNYPLSGFAYVNEVMAEQVEKTRANLKGVMPDESLNRTGHLKKVCTPAFGAMEMVTQTNGPLWILGQPLFFQYNVNFDRKARTIGLEPHQSCSSCGPAAPSKSSSLAEQESIEPRRPRMIHGLPRLPNLRHNEGTVVF